MFEAFGLSQKLVRESYWVNETVFWRPSPEDRSRIVRTGASRTPRTACLSSRTSSSTRPGCCSTCSTTCSKSPTRLEPDYGLEFVTLKVEAEGDHPGRGHAARRGQPARRRTVRAKYVVGCDGARSRVREAIGAALRGDFANHAWGVVDMLAVTDFPDIRLKAAIQSADEGNILLIPREGGYLVRLYVDLGEIDPNNREAFRLNHAGEGHRDRPARAAPLHARRAETWPGSRSTRSASASPTGSTTYPRTRPHLACRASSSPAMPATRTAPRPARA